jgi:hypothetical protein
VDDYESDHQRPATAVATAAGKEVNVVDENKEEEEFRHSLLVQEDLQV